MATLVVAIDVGVKNLGICCFDFLTNQVVHWDNISLVPSGRYIPAQNVHYVHEFVKRHHHLFDNAIMIVIERQMRCNMRIIEAVLQSMFVDRCRVISARSVKVHYNISTRNYRANKAKAIDWATEFTSANPGIFASDVLDNFRKRSKRDDLSDALLLLMYYLDTYSTQLSY